MSVAAGQFDASAGDLRMSYLSHHLNALLSTASSLRQMPKVRLCVCMALSAFPMVVPAGEARAQVRARQSVAIVVGIGRYANRGFWPDVPSTKRDAAELGAWLKKQGYVVHVLLDSAATRARIVSVVADSVAPSLGPTDDVLFFFSGHGTTQSLGFDSIGSLVPFDATRSSGTLLTEGSVLEFARMLGRARHLLFILNACFSGSFAVPRLSGDLSPGNRAS